MECAKRAFPSLPDAERAIRRIRQSHFAKSVVPVRAYRCERCACWHVTSEARVKRSKPLARGQGLSRGTSQLKRSPLKAVSDRKRARLPEYEAAKFEMWIRHGHTCYAAPLWPDVTCEGEVRAHHVAPRGMYPELECDPDNLRPVCWAHHVGPRGIHMGDPVRARQLGLLI